ncbi:MAG: ABC transporter substrate-binding protein [Bacteroidetes bacterium]|jgi:iron complex transport system substrate-binding protein|nr:ABC transporter substrate-binding protein [Bacteroidota bacterium]
MKRFKIKSSPADGFYRRNYCSKTLKWIAEWRVFPSDGFLAKAFVLPLMLFATTLPAIAQQSYTGSDDVEVAIDDLSRVVSIGSAITETIYAIGAEGHLIAVDESSTFPGETENLTKVPFTRNLSAEGLLSVSPSLILASAAAGPPTVVNQVRGAGVPLLKLTADETVQAAFERTRQLGQIFEKEEAAEQLIQNMKADLDIAETARSRITDKPSVLFIYARGANMLMVAGNGTSAKKMIELAGGENAFNSFNGYKPLTAEAVVEANPDLILMMNSGIQSVGGKEGVLQAPGVSLTEAAKNERVYSMDGAYLLNFGPRLGQAALDLMAKFHPGIELTENLQASDGP